MDDIRLLLRGAAEVGDKAPSKLTPAALMVTNVESVYARLNTDAALVMLQANGGIRGRAGRCSDAEVEAGPGTGDATAVRGAARGSRLPGRS